MNDQTKSATRLRGRRLSFTASRQHYSAAKARRQHRGFTLIELLVVIAIIAILAAMLLPVLGKAKRRAALAVCEANQKQFALSETLFAGDHNDFIISASTAANKTDDGYFAWRADPNNITVPAAPVGQSFQNWGDDYGYTLGAFYPYAKSPDIIHCPADTRYSVGLYPAWCSYSMVDNNCGNGFTVGDKYHIYYLHQIKNPVDRMVINEENDPRTEGSYFENEGTWEPYHPGSGGDAPNPTGNPSLLTLENGGTPGWYDAPAAYHLNSADFSMFDGHVEVRKWRGPDTQAIANSPTPNKYSGPYAGSASLANPLDKDDVYYVYSHIATPYWP